MLEPRHLLFTYLHLAADKPQAEGLMKSGATCIAYETVTSQSGALPLLKPMSEVAGRMSIQVGAHYLEKEPGGRGVLLGGVPGVAPAKVAILGGGVAGVNAAQMAVGMRADVTIYDISNERLAELDMFFGSQIKTAYASRSAIARAVNEAELVIGAVLVPGAAAPKLVTRDMLKTMKRGSVLVDIAIDQGGCFETSHATTHSDPVYEVDGVIHYCVANMPGAVARTSAFALNNATLPFAIKLANLGAEASDAPGSAPRQRSQCFGRQDPSPGGRRSARSALRTGLMARLGRRWRSPWRHQGNAILDHRPPAGIGRRVGKICAIAGPLPQCCPTGLRPARGKSAARDSRAPAPLPVKGKPRCRRDRSGMIGQRIAQADPQLIIARMLARACACSSLAASSRVAARSKRVRHVEPGVGIVELAHHCLACAGQRHRRRAAVRCARLTSKPGIALQRITGAAEGNGRSGQGQHRSAQLQQPQQGQS